MPFLPPLPHKCTSVCRKKINNYIHTRYLINYFFNTHFLYENMWQKWHCGRMCLSLKNNGRYYCIEWNFSLSLQSITNRSCHRDSACESSRWSVGVIAMEWRGRTVGFTKRDWRFLKKGPINRQLWRRNETQE